MPPTTLAGVKKVDELPPRVVPHRTRSRGKVALAGRTGLRLVQLGIKYRKRLAPVYAAAGLNAAGGVLAASHNGPATAAAIDAAGAIALAWWIRRRTRSKRALRGNRLAWALINSGGAAALLFTMSLVGPLTPPMPGLTLLWFLAAAGPYWWHRRIRPIEDVDVEDRIRLWNERVACQGGALPDAQLTDISGEENWKGRIILPAGRLTTSNAVSAIERIASAYSVPMSSVVIEPPESGDADKAEIAVYVNNPLQEVNYWPGPSAFDPAVGIAHVGQYPDGERVGYVFWKPGSGAVHSLISGSSDAGKSRLLDLLLATERGAGGLIVSWVCDPQRGQSLPDWQDNVDEFADSREEAVIRLLVTRDVMLARNERYAKVIWTDDKGRQRRGKSSFAPGRVADGEDPLLSLTIDEAHDVLSHSMAAEAAEDIALMGRKCGIKLRLVTQMPLLSQLGNSSPLRDSVAAGNVFCLRTSSALSGQVAFQSSFEVAPHKLPRAWPGVSDPAKKYTYGLGYALGAESRCSVMRTSLIDDVYAWATEGQTWGLGPEDAAVAKLSYAKWEAIIRDGASTPKEVADRMFSPAKTPAARKAESTTYKQAITDYLATVSDFAYTGAIAHAVDAPLQTVSTTLSRLAKAGTVTKLGHGKWAMKQSAAAAA